MDKFMWEMKINNISMQLHHRYYADEGLQYDNTSQRLLCPLHGRHVTEFLINSCMFAYQ